MADHTLSAQGARQLANTTKTPPQWIGVTPRWLVSMLPWTLNLTAGTHRRTQSIRHIRARKLLRCQFHPL